MWKTCPECGQPFETNRSARVYCPGYSCSNKANARAREAAKLSGEIKLPSIELSAAARLIPALVSTGVRVWLHDAVLGARCSEVLPVSPLQLRSVGDVECLVVGRADPYYEAVRLSQLKNVKRVLDGAGLWRTRAAQFDAMGVDYRWPGKPGWLS